MTGLIHSQGYNNYFGSIKKIISSVIICLFLMVALPLPSNVNADGTGKTVRVGWYESPFCHVDEAGRRSGYAYEYQIKIASYTGWNYEYVEGDSWVELFHMLERGEIDMLSDVSYTKERAEKILYPSIPMGQEMYYIYVDSQNSDIRADDVSTLNGKRIGVTGDSVQNAMLNEWVEKYGIRADIVDLFCSEDESLRLMLNGEFDAFVSLDTYGDANNLIPVAMIGTSDFYFAVSSLRPDLLNELDSALISIQSHDRYYSQNLYNKYLTSSENERYLSTEEIDWLNAHGPIRVGYQDNYLAFCAKDESSGELTGALHDYLDYASSQVINYDLKFETVCFSTASDAITALQNGEIDVVFPANFTTYSAETIGVVSSPPLIGTEMLAVVRSSDQQSFSKKENIKVAVNEGNPNYDLFLEYNFPDWEPVYYADSPACLKAVSDGEADCILVSSFRFGNISGLCKKYNLTTQTTGVDMDYCFAIKAGNTELYSVISKITGLVPSTYINSTLNYYSTQDAQMTFGDYVAQNLGIVMTIVSAVLLVFLILTARSVHLERKANKEMRQVKDLSHRVNYDALTSVRNKGAFNDYISDIQSKISKGDLSEVAVCIFDCNDLKKINDKYGHNRGDEYIMNSCHFICTTFRRSAVFRIGGDEFAAVMMNEDFKNKDELVEKFHREQEAINETAEEPWNMIRIAMGLAVYSAETDSSIEDTVKRADELMYDNKRMWKESKQKK